MLNRLPLILLAALALSTSALAGDAGSPQSAAPPASKKGRWVAQATTTIDATPAQVMSLVADLGRWKEWTAWGLARDPNGAWTSTGTPATVGHEMSWDGPEIKTGRLVLTRVEGNHIEYDFYFGKSKTPAFGSFTLTGEGPTTVVWYDDGKAHLFKNKISKMVTADLEQGLANLKTQAEALAAHDRQVAKIAAAEAELAALKATSEARVKAATDAKAAAEAARKAATDAEAAAAKAPRKTAEAAKKAAADAKASAEAAQLTADKAAQAAGESAVAVAAKAAELEALKAAK